MAFEIPSQQIIIIQLRIGLMRVAKRSEPMTMYVIVGSEWEQVRPAYDAAIAAVACLAIAERKQIRILIERALDRWQLVIITNPQEKEAQHEAEPDDGASGGIGVGV